MNVDTNPVVRHAPPPRIVVRLTNPLLRLLLRTPASRAIRPLALLTFRGRHTGTSRRVVVGWHLVEGKPVVLTPARWRVNFTNEHPVSVRWRGNDTEFVATLEVDADQVAHVVNGLLCSGSSARSLALRIPTGHAVTAQDVIDTHRGVLRFAPATTHRDSPQQFEITGGPIV